MTVVPDEKLYTIEAAVRYVLSYPRVLRRVDEVVLHHTWSPTAKDYRGLATVQAVRRYHMRPRVRSDGSTQPGWSDNGYHWMVAPNGDVWRCRPMVQAGAHVAGRNQHTVGVAAIANFDEDYPGRWGGWDELIVLLAALLRRFQLSPANIRFHREFADKTCPGTHVSLDTVRTQVGRELGDPHWQDPEPDGGTQLLQVVLMPDGKAIACDARLEGGVTRANLRAVAEALGAAVEAKLSEGRILVYRSGAG